MSGVEAAADALGNKVWDALEAEGHVAAPTGSGLDGFDVLRPHEEPNDHVFVLFRREGILHLTGGNAVVRQNLGPIKRDLEDAGFEVRMHEHHDKALGLVVATTPEAADRALTYLAEYAASVDGGAP
jgi:hypothetical protein